ncbi:MAG: porin family protein [Bacteroidota bacterium]|nr:porin family protein [Bacteroidota bacterium]MEC9108846.1 porin family protein [Bacteroidota bacterium]
MKKVLFILIFLFSVNIGYSQLFTKKKVLNNENFDKPSISWGYFLGLNNYDFNFDYKNDLEDIQTEKSFGFNVGLIGNVRINDYLDFRFEPGLVMSKRSLIYDPTNFNETEFNPIQHQRDIKSTYIHFPLLLKISTKRVNNIKPYITGGFSAAINLSSKEKSLDDNNLGQFRMKKNTFFYELGFGIDFYLEWFKFSPSIRGIFAISDELVPDEDPLSPWTSNIEFMKTSGIVLNFTFQ